MDKIRIGKDIFISWELTTTDESVILSKDNLSLEMTLPNRCIAQLPITFSNGVLYSSFYGIDQTQLGNYWLTVWYKRNEVGQSALDKVLAFQLVRSTEDETHNDESIAYADVNLSGTIGINKGGVDTYTKEEINDLIADVHQSFQAADLQYNIIAKDYTDEEVKKVDNKLTAHTTNSTIHVTAADKQRWNNKQDALAYNFASMTQSQYDALSTKDNNTIYFITE